MKLHMHVDASEEGEPPFSAAEAEKLERVFEEELPLLCQGPDSNWNGNLKKYSSAEVSVSFMSPEEIREINKNHRGVDEPTDVLTFPLWEQDGSFQPDAAFDLLPLGDILICPEEAEREHLAGSADPAGALCLVLAHGFLHLLAWDHDTPEKERKMWERQDILKAKLSAALEAM